MTDTMRAAAEMLLSEDGVLETRKADLIRRMRKEVISKNATKAKVIPRPPMRLPILKDKIKTQWRSELLQNTQDQSRCL